MTAVTNQPADQNFLQASKFALGFSRSAVHSVLRAGSDRSFHLGRITEAANSVP